MAARLPCGTVPDSIQTIMASTVSRRTFGPDAVENQATCGESTVLRRREDAGVGGERLAREDVERRAADLPGLERVGEGVLVDQRTARDVHQQAPGRMRSNCAGPISFSVVGQQRQVQRDEVARLEQLVEVVAARSRRRAAAGEAGS